MSRVGVNIYKRKDGRWEGRYIKGYDINGKAKYGYVYAKYCAEAKEKLLEVQCKSIVGIIPPPITFTDLSKRWLYSTKLRVKESTYAGYVNLLERHILPDLGGYRLNKLTSGVIDRFASEKLTNGRVDKNGSLSANTVRNILALIKSVITYGENEKLIGKDVVTVTYPKSTTREIRVFSKEEQLSLESVLLCDMDMCKLGILICLYTGIRIGELCSLRWADISADGKTVSIRSTVQRIENHESTLPTKTR